MKALSINKCRCRCRWKKCKCLYSKECVPWQVWPINLSNKDLCFSLGNKLLQEATDAFTLFADAKTELNHWHRGLIKPDLHDDCKRLCSSSRAIIDWLFGDDLQKHVKDLTEVNPIDKKRWPQILGCPPGLLMLEIQGTTDFPQVMDEDIVRPEG